MSHTIQRSPNFSNKEEGVAPDIVPEINPVNDTKRITRAINGAAPAAMFLILGHVALLDNFT